MAMLRAAQRIEGAFASGFALASRPRGIKPGPSEWPQISTRTALKMRKAWGVFGVRSAKVNPLHTQLLQVHHRAPHQRWPGRALASFVRRPANLIGGITAVAQEQHRGHPLPKVMGREHLRGAAFAGGQRRDHLRGKGAVPQACRLLGFGL